MSRKRVKKVQFDCENCGMECSIIYSIKEDMMNNYVQCCPFCGEEVNYYDDDEKEVEDEELE